MTDLLLNISDGFPGGLGHGKNGNHVRDGWPKISPPRPATEKDVLTANKLLIPVWQAVSLPRPSPPSRFSFNDHQFYSAVYITALHLHLI